MRVRRTILDGAVAECEVSTSCVYWQQLSGVRSPLHVRGRQRRNATLALRGAKTMVRLRRGYVSGWIGQTGSGGGMAEGTCDGLSVRDSGLTRLMRIYGLD